MDNDCNGLADDGLTTDVDSDGYTASGSCTGSGDDCDDGDSSVWPGAPEDCDGVDDDCDGQVDEGFFQDQDLDFFVNDACGGTDCDDTDPLVFPGAPEGVCDVEDRDCDGISSYNPAACGDDDDAADDDDASDDDDSANPADDDDDDDNGPSRVTVQSHKKPPDLSDLGRWDRHQDRGVIS